MAAIASHSLMIGVKRTAPASHPLVIGDKVAAAAASNPISLSCHLVAGLRVGQVRLGLA